MHNIKFYNRNRNILVDDKYRVTCRKRDSLIYFIDFLDAVSEEFAEEIVCDISNVLFNKNKKEYEEHFKITNIKKKRNNFYYIGNVDCWRFCIEFKPSAYHALKFLISCGANIAMK